ncbi:MAG: hypothetical protein IJG13_13420 [Kiritimatiellae bacterium]|nr:hypothetical protein [Kiritimatiellia bacterium]
MIGFAKKEDGFDWRSVPAVDPDEVDRWLGCTDAKDRQFPLQVALQVHDEIEARLMQPGAVDDADLREARGGMRALRRFAELYSKILVGR